MLHDTIDDKYNSTKFPFIVPEILAVIEIEIEIDVYNDLSCTTFDTVG